MAESAESGTTEADTPRRSTADARNEAEDDKEDSEAFEEEGARATGAWRRGVSGMDAPPLSAVNAANGEGNDIGGSSSDSAVDANKGDAVRSGSGVCGGDADARRLISVPLVARASSFAADGGARAVLEIDLAAVASSVIN